MGESGPRKRKDDPFDDFFALSAPSGKKHKKKRPREKKVENHEDEKRNETHQKRSISMSMSKPAHQLLIQALLDHHEKIQIATIKKWTIVTKNH